MGVATNVEFTFSVATADQEAAIYMANPGPDQTTVITPITQEWLDAYEARIKSTGMISKKRIAKSKISKGRVECSIN